MIIIKKEGAVPDDVRSAPFYIVERIYLLFLGTARLALCLPFYHEEKELRWSVPRMNIYNPFYIYINFDYLVLYYTTI